MRKLAIALAISLLPIFAVPANAGVITCKYKQVRHLDPNGKTTGWKYSYRHVCSYKKYGGR